MSRKLSFAIAVAGWLAPITAQPAQKASATLPSDVANFVERRDICDHFRGEPFEGDPARRKFVGEQEDKYCSGTDRELARLKKKYFNRSMILRKLQGYEPCIEASSNCR